MITILEGPDGSGKTTLAKSTGYVDYIHFGPPPKGALGAWRQYLALLIDLWDNPRRADNVVIDRFIHGEMIYGPILRGGTDLTWAHIRMLERVLMGLEADLTICLPPYEVVYDNWYKNRDDELIKDPLQIATVYDFYLNLLGRDSMIPRRVYDYTQPHGQEVLSNLTQGHRFPNEGPGIGLFCPGNILLVGEKINPKTGKEGWPFVAPDSSSIWLAELLDAAKIPEHSLYWVNAATNHQMTDPRFIDKLQPSKVIAMGGKAEVWCRLNKIGHENVAHPQWHKRFRYNDEYPLIGMLR